MMRALWSRKDRGRGLVLLALREIDGASGPKVATGVELRNIPSVVAD